VNTLAIPENVSLKTTVSQATSITMHISIVSQSKAAEIAGVSRHEFLEALNRFNVSPFQVTSEELAEELARE
jgi:predicted HTH domain antitoxin